MHPKTNNKPASGLVVLALGRDGTCRWTIQKLKSEALPNNVGCSVLPGDLTGRKEKLMDGLRIAGGEG
jgi:hypothetical protein